MGPVVVLRQDLTEPAGRYATVRRQTSQRVTGSWVTVTGKRRKVTCSYTSVMPTPLG